MKKITFILGLFYLLSVVGYGLEFHYCLGQITDVSLAWLDTSCVCDESESITAHHCCDEKEFFVQIDEPHQLVASGKILDHSPRLIAEFGYQIFNESVNSERNDFIKISADPPDPVAVYKKNCAFIFYG